MYMISVSARELLEWCDVPRTKEDYMAGYQRLLGDTRVEEIGAYLSRSPNNILPGAIIVAADLQSTIWRQGSMPERDAKSIYPNKR